MTACLQPVDLIHPLHYSPFGHYRKWKWISPTIAVLILTFLVCVQLLYLALGSNVYAFTEIAGRIVREKGGFIFFLFSFFFSCAISCLQKPLMPIQHQHQGTALMSILATDLFLSPLPAALSLSLSLFFSLSPFIPSSSLRSLFTVTVQSNN